MAKEMFHCNRCGKTFYLRKGFVKGPVTFREECPRCGAIVVKEYYRKVGFNDLTKGRGSALLWRMYSEDPAG